MASNDDIDIDVIEGQQPPRPNDATYWVTPQLLAGEYPGHRSGNKDMTRQKLRHYLQCGMTHFIDLTHEGEKADYADLLQQEAEALGVTAQYQRFAIPDFGVPQDSHLMATILDAMDNAITTSNINNNVYVHCRGGIGRTGTTVGCYLVRHGYSGDDALQLVHTLFQSSSRSAESWSSPETQDQRAFVQTWKG